MAFRSACGGNKTLYAETENRNGGKHTKSRKMRETAWRLVSVPSPCAFTVYSAVKCIANWIKNLNFIVSHPEYSFYNIEFPSWKQEIIYPVYKLKENMSTCGNFPYNFASESVYFFIFQVCRSGLGIPTSASCVFPSTSVSSVFNSRFVISAITPARRAAHNLFQARKNSQEFHTTNAPPGNTRAN